MITEQQYSDALKIVSEWLDSQPADSQYPYKPKQMSTEDYVRQRALNEILRHFDTNTNMSVDEFESIIKRFDLSPHIAKNDRGDNVIFLKHVETTNLFTGKKVKKNEVIPVPNTLRNKDKNDNSI
jgi:hypothetical protein